MRKLAKHSTPASYPLGPSWSHEPQALRLQVMLLHLLLEGVPPIDLIRAVLPVVAFKYAVVIGPACPAHSFQILTVRSRRCCEAPCGNSRLKIITQNLTGGAAHGPVSGHNTGRGHQLHRRPLWQLTGLRLLRELAGQPCRQWST